MIRQRENDVWSSVSFAYMAVNTYDVNFKASLIIECILIDNFHNYYFMFLNRQMHLKR
jgi:hypothetical protein